MDSGHRAPGHGALSGAAGHAENGGVLDPYGEGFSALTSEGVALLRRFLQTRDDVLIVPGASAGGLEAAVVNTFSPGDAVLAVSVGVYGDRFARAAEAFGLDVRRLSLPRGKAAEPEQLQQALEENADVAAVLLTHNEASTGVTNPLSALAPMVEERGLLLLVDAIGSLGATPIRAEELGLDIVVASSHEAWRMPPGLVMLSVGARAWEAAEKARLPRFYWDFARARNALQRGMAPYAPAVTLVAGLVSALRAMDAEGMESLWRRHAVIGARARAGVRAIGLEPFADERYASDIVTTVRLPAGLDGKRVRERLVREHGVLVGEGQAEMASRLLRIGHLGYIAEADVDATLRALAAVVSSERAGPGT